MCRRSWNRIRRRPASKQLPPAQESAGRLAVSGYRSRRGGTPGRSNLRSRPFGFGPRFTSERSIRSKIQNFYSRSCARKAAAVDKEKT